MVRPSVVTAFARRNNGRQLEFISATCSSALNSKASATCCGLTRFNEATKEEEDDVRNFSSMAVW